MSEVNNGLRFDIYERVHLPDNVAAIEELEEIELVPRIQVIDQGDQAILKGQLVLNGIYRGQGEEGEQIALEHWIPVEISLPMNRVTKLDDITIDIDTFDVDLLSSRALNITGILSLRGITLESEELQEHSWEADEFTVSHEREQSLTVETELVTQENEEPIVQPEAELFEFGQAHVEEKQDFQHDLGQESRIQIEDQQLLGEQGHEAEIAEAYLDDIAIESEEEIRKAQWVEYAAESEEEIDEEQRIEEATEQSYLEEVENIEPTNAVVLDHPAEEIDQSELSIVDQVQRNDQPVIESIEPQIAINGTQQQQNETTGIRSILQSSLREQAVQQANLEQQETERQQEEAAKPPVVDDEIEWQNLFLSKRPDQNEFRKIKMCIVQKEDTLEQIALRYSVNPRELLVHNNLHESAILEGQLLYIP